MSDSSFRYNNGNKIYANDNLYNAWNFGSYLVDTSKGYNNGSFFKNGTQATETQGATAPIQLLIPSEENETLLGQGRGPTGEPLDITNGDIAEVILYSEILGTESQNATHYYLSQKYGIDAPATPENRSTAFDTTSTGTHTIYYHVKDAAGNLASASRTVVIEGNNNPILTVIENPLIIPLGGSSMIRVQRRLMLKMGIYESVLAEFQLLDVNKLGTYSVAYLVADSAGGTANADRTVIVADLTAPVVTLKGDAEVTIAVGTTYTEAGIEAPDNVTEGETLIATLNHLTSEGLVLHLDAAQIQNTEDGAVLDVWEDSSGRQPRFSDSGRFPTYIHCRYRKW